MATSAVARGRRSERRIAAALGGKRVIAPGRIAPDVVAPLWVAEVKNTKSGSELPLKYITALAQFAQPDQIRLFVYKRPAWRDYIVCMLLKDFEELHGQLGGPKE